MRILLVVFLSSFTKSSFISVVLLRHEMMSSEKKDEFEEKDVISEMRVLLCDDESSSL